jgi:hypothetical protein
MVPSSRKAFVTRADDVCFEPKNVGFEGRLYLLQTTINLWYALCGATGASMEGFNFQSFIAMIEGRWKTWGRRLGSALLILAALYLASWLVDGTFDHAISTYSKATAWLYPPSWISPLLA